MKNSAIIGLGSNIYPEANIKKAKEFLQKEFGILKESRFVTTKPIGMTGASDFINGAVLIETSLELVDLKSRLRVIEKDLGRVRTANKYSSRTIDLDIIVWNRKIIDEDYYKRDFLKISVHEIYPDL